MLPFHVIAILTSCLSVMSIATASELAPGQLPEYEVPAWYDGARYQIHARWWIDPDELGDSADLTVASHYERMGVTAHTRHLKSADEGAIWSSSVGGIHPAVATMGNHAQKIIDSSHDAGLKIISYYRHMEDSWCAENHPEWRARYRDGKPAQLGRGPGMSFASPYLDFLITRLLELVDMGVEGFYLDEHHINKGEGDFSEFAQKKYRGLYQRDLLQANDKEVHDFRQIMLRDTFLAISRAVLARDPDSVLLVSANTVSLDIFRDNLFVKFEPHIAKKLGGFPLAISILRDAADGRMPHCWIRGSRTKQTLGYVARLLAWGAVYNRDIPEALTATTPDTTLQHFAEQIELGRKVSSALAGTRPLAWAKVHVDGSHRIKQDVLASQIAPAFYGLVKERIPVGAIIDSQIKEGIPEGTKMLVLPVGIPSHCEPAVSAFQAGGGIVVTPKALSGDWLKQIDHTQVPVTVMGGNDKMEMIPYLSDDGSRMVVALAGRPQKASTLIVRSPYKPISAREVLSEKELSIVEEDGVCEIVLPAFGAMACVELKLN